MLSFIYMYLAWIIVLVKRLLAYLYLWQKKEYRLDKTIDYINTPESQGFLWDTFSKIYFVSLGLFFAFYILFTSNLGDKPFILTATFGIILLLNIIFWIDAILAIIKLLKKRLLIPKFSAKMIFIFSISIAILALLTGLTSNQPFAVSTVYELLIIFSIPFIILLSTLLVKPLEIYKKKQIIKEAIEKRAQMKKLKVIAVSGSYGKTTTKDILYQLLKNTFNVVKTQKNQNTNLSLARQIINLDSKTEIFISEIGSYKKGDGIDSCIFLSPTTSIITGLNNQHLSLFGSEQAIVEAESESLDFLPKNGKAYINYDSTLCKDIIIPKNVQTVSYGLDAKHDIHAKILSVEKSQTVFNLHLDGKTTKLTTNLLSIGNIENLVGAISVATDLGVSIGDIKKIITHLESTPGTLEILSKSWGNFINDSYNANINGVINAIDLLSEFAGKKILVLDDILELGDQAEPTHNLLAAKIAKTPFDLIIFMGRNYADLMYNYLENENYKGNYLIYEKNQKQALETLKKIIKKPTQVLLEGYRSRIFLDKI